MDIKSFQRALGQIAETRGISPEVIIGTLEAAIATAYKKDYGQKGQKIKAKFNPVSGDVQFWQLKLAVDESMLYTQEEIDALREKKIVPSEDFDRIQEDQEAPKKVVFNSEKHIMIDEAQKKDPKIQLGEELEIPLVSKQDYGRIAAQTAKQVILQKIREAEKDVIASEYRSKEGEIISGVVQRIEGSTILIDIGKTLGILNREEQIPGEFYRQSQRLKFYILKVEDGPKGSMVMLSRAYPKLVSRLFELEVPEISSGIVVIKSIAREPGYRTKIAVASTESGIDPIGSCVGQRGTRIMAVINELGGEKIDVIEWKDDPAKFITNALSPAKISGVKIDPLGGGKNTAVVFVSEGQLSLAIGKDGRNVRLASNLTGWKIDIKPDEKAVDVKDAKDGKKDAEDLAEEKPEGEKEEKPKKKPKKTKKNSEETEKVSEEK
ncbi:MAG: transcription termination factor NusA [Candidatus Staskawiczbacteria bacterium RIFCSPLOWO2_01_FULL_38_12b]|uniref:Transcription termination/antitermination protein NusA n=1 Tax=Candidatus Staskawiczbacteria bacterium RIFCSPLOWO2_01_FULL_38_12b TaxID=1802214 RepID=A0A1G2ID65_9BACT|nr:MAG: transcription termination factor NusA [Candidatus Staskawiczbacteria bacterium RIFCSPLOWO2_01_FULL_38_12b]